MSPRRSSMPTTGRLADFERLATAWRQRQGQNRPGPLRRELPRGQGLHRAAVWGGGRAHLLRPRRWRLKAGATYPAAPGDRTPASSAARCSSCPSIPATRLPPAWPPLPSCPTSQRIPVDKLQYDQPSIPVNPLSLSRRRPDPAGARRRRRRRGSGRARSASPITSATARHRSPSTCSWCRTASCAPSGTSSAGSPALRCATSW